MSMELLRTKMLEMLKLGIKYETEHKGEEVTAVVTFEILDPGTGRLVLVPASIQQYINGGRRDLACMLMAQLSEAYPPDYVYQIHRAYMRHVVKAEEGEIEKYARVKDMPGRLEIIGVGGKDREGNVALVYREVIPKAEGLGCDYGEVQWLEGAEESNTAMMVLDSVTMRD